MQDGLVRPKETDCRPQTENGNRGEVTGTSRAKRTGLWIHSGIFSQEKEERELKSEGEKKKL